MGPLRSAAPHAWRYMKIPKQRLSMYVNTIDCSDYLLTNAIALLEGSEDFHLSQALESSQIELKKVKEGEHWNSNGVNYEYVQFIINAQSQDIKTIKSDTEKTKSKIIVACNEVLMASGFIHVQWKPIVKLLPKPLPLEDFRERKISKWNGCYFRSKPEIKIAEILEEMQIPFIANGRGRFNVKSSRKTYEPDFLVFYNGKVGILEVDGKIYHPESEKEKSQERDNSFVNSGVKIIAHYDGEDCNNSPQKVVEKFLTLFCN